MTGKTHATAGALFGVLFAEQIVEQTFANGNDNVVVSAAGVIASVIGASVLGSLLPDIDIDGSAISKFLFPFRLVYRILGAIFKEFKIHWFKHRGLTHTLLIPVLGFMFACLFVRQTPEAYSAYSFYVACGVAVGALSHLLLDAMNPTGVPVLAPFTKRNIHIMPKFMCITTGSGVEKFFFAILLFGTIGYSCYCGYGWWSILH